MDIARNHKKIQWFFFFNSRQHTLRKNRILRYHSPQKYLTFKICLVTNFQSCAFKVGPMYEIFFYLFFQVKHCTSNKRFSFLLNFLFFVPDLWFHCFMVWVIYLIYSLIKVSWSPKWLNEARSHSQYVSEAGLELGSSMFKGHYHALNHASKLCYS